MLKSRNPDQKIKATAAIESSKKKAVNLDANPTRAKLNSSDTTVDLKFCLIYSYKKPNRDFTFAGKILFRSYKG